ncbi:MAG: response regulator [Candidatus Hydrogenedentota bacterium]
MAKILIVDDDEQTAQQIASDLKQAGHTCATLDDGATVLSVARKSDLDLLILDVMLPSTSGFEVCRQIRRDDKLYMLPILLVSSMSDEAEIQHGLEQGADGYVTKPIDTQNFMVRVERMLQVNQNSDYIDSTTGLPDAEGTRKLVQQHITRNDAFALVYVELLRLKEFSARAGIDGREKALRHLTRALHHCAENLLIEDYLLGHVGGGYFICMLPIDGSERYCEKVLKSWHNHMLRFYKTPNLKVNYEEALSRDEVLDLTMCVTYRETGDHITAQQLLETVSRIHKIANIDGLPGIHMDRRVL